MIQPIYVRLQHDAWPARVKALDGVTQCYAVHYARKDGTQRQRVRWAKRNPGNLAGWVFRFEKEDWAAFALGNFNTEWAAQGMDTRYAAARALHKPLTERRSDGLIKQLAGAIIGMAKEAAKLHGAQGSIVDEVWREYLTEEAERALRRAGALKQDAKDKD